MRARVYSVRLRDSWWVLTAPTNSILSSEFCASYGGTALTKQRARRAYSEFFF
jgi:hypothetical protein